MGLRPKHGLDSRSPLGAEFFAAKDFDVVHEGNHGVVFKIIPSDMLKNFLGNIGRSDHLDFRVWTFPVTRTDAPCPFPMDDRVRITSSAEIVYFLYDLVLYGIVTDNRDALHRSCFHVWIFSAVAFRVRRFRRHQGLMMCAASVKSATTVEAAAIEPASAEATPGRATHCSSRIAAGKT
jgi:hypothetical protein